MNKLYLFTIERLVKEIKNQKSLVGYYKGLYTAEKLRIRICENIVEFLNASGSCVAICNIGPKILPTISASADFVDGNILTLILQSVLFLYHS